MDKFQNRFRIPSARANWHDYNGGIYFVTICTKNREHYFGEITHCCRDVVRNVCFRIGVHCCRDVARNVSTEPQMQLSPIGQYAYEQFMNVKSHYPYAEIPLFVIMPDHIHAIVTIDGENEIGGNGVHTQCGDVARRCGDVARNVSTSARNVSTLGVHTVSTDFIFPINRHNGMDMVGHYHEQRNFSVWIMRFYIHELFVGILPDW